MKFFIPSRVQGVVLDRRHEHLQGIFIWIHRANRNMQTREIDTNGLTIVAARYQCPSLSHYHLDLCGVKVARDVGVGDILPVDQLAQEEVVRVWQVPCLEYLWQYHDDHRA